MDLRWKKNKRRILVICLNLCLLVLAGLSYREDSYSREVGLSEFHVMEEAAVTAQEEAGMTFDTGSSGDALLLCGPYISVPAGRYALTVQYTADVDGAVCEIYSNQVVNEDNSRGRVFATEVLPAGENTIVIPYETEERIGGMEYKFLSCWRSCFTFCTGFAGTEEMGIWSRYGTAWRCLFWLCWPRFRP